MVEDFTLHEGAALYGLLTETNCDIVLKLDREGFVIHASSAIEQLGIEVAQTLIAPHLAELAIPSQSDKLRAFIAVVMQGGGATGWFEFGARMASGDVHLFTLQLRPLLDGDGAVYGAVGIMRSIEERRLLEDRLFAATMTDPLTGLANRRAFQAMLGHLVRRRPGGSLVLLDIDDLRTIGLRHGASAGDKLIAAVARLLRDLLQRDHIVARIGDDRFAVLMPGDGVDEADAICTEVLDALGEATQVGGLAMPSVRACIGIAQIRGRADDVLKRAELAVIHAKARGHGRIENSERLPEIWRRSA